MEHPEHPLEPEDSRVYGAQLALLIGFSCFAALVIAWIARLIYVSWVLADVFSASIGIALVAVPIFLTLAIIFNYVFWGLHRGRQQGQVPSSDEPR